MGPSEIGSMSEMRRPGGAWHWDMRTTDPQALGDPTIRLFVY